MSPIGVPIRSQENLEKGMMNNRRRRPPGWVRAIGRFVWAIKLSPFGILRGIGERGGRRFISRYMANRMDMLSEEERVVMHNYLH